VYVLGTNLYTKDGQEIIQIGITTGSVEARINQLYTTGVPFRFRVIKTLDTTNYEARASAAQFWNEPEMPANALKSTRPVRRPG
jgi:hypothetical protein